mgnify:CR=1 FL=1
MGARNAVYDRLGAGAALGRPTISIGNVVAGGTGKTPVTAWIARRLIAAGHRPLIALRGYASAADPERSDEALEYRELLPQTPLAIGADRRRAIASIDRATFDVVLLDDAFQHRRLRRDLDLVLVDATRPSLEDALLPCGWLREPATALRRADAVIVTRAKATGGALADRIAMLHGRPPIAWLRHVWRRLAMHAPTGRCELLPLDWLRGRRVAVCAGVGNPAAFFEQLEASGALIAAQVPARDHQRFDEAFLRGLEGHLGGARPRGADGGVDALVVSRKDWVKLRAADWARLGAPVAVPELEIEPIEGEEALAQIVLAAAQRSAGRE